MPSRRRRFRARPKPQPKKPPANREINATEVRLIDTDGTQLGVIPITEAREKAETTGADLVLVAGKTDPPVARLLDLGKYMYEQRKKQAKQKTTGKGGAVKGVRIGFKIGEHDWQLRLNQAERFLDEGNKVKLEIRLRGREKGRLPQAHDKLQEFIAAIPGGAKVEDPSSKSTRGLSILLTR